MAIPPPAKLALDHVAVRERQAQPFGRIRHSWEGSLETVANDRRPVACAAIDR